MEIGFMPPSELVISVGTMTKKPRQLWGTPISKEARLWCVCPCWLSPTTCGWWLCVKCCLANLEPLNSWMVKKRSQAWSMTWTILKSPHFSLRYPGWMVDECFVSPNQIRAFCFPKITHSILPGKRILIAKNPNVPGLRPAAMRMALAGLLGVFIGLLVDFSYFPWPRQIALAAALAAFVGPVSFQLQKVGAGIVWDLWEEHQAYETSGDFYRHPDSIHNDRHMTIVDIQYLVGALEHVLFFHSVGNISSSQLTKSYVSEGLKPPTRYNYNTHMLHVWYIYLQNSVIFKANVGKYSSTMGCIWDKIRSGLFILLDWWHGTHVRPGISSDHQMKSSFESMKTMGVSECSH